MGIRSRSCPSFFRTNLHESMRGTDTAMESTAIGLITQAPFTAAEIATAVLHGIEAGDAVIVPDDIAVSMIAMKRTDPEAYAVGLRRRRAPGASGARRMSADAAAAVREEDAFEVAAVTEWLREKCN